MKCRFDNLKIRPEHAQVIADAVEAVLKDHPDIQKQYTDAGLTPMRCRWDLFWEAHRRFPDVHKTVRTIYEYVNDDHIDTLLRRIVKG